MKRILTIWLLLAGMAVGSLAQQRLATPTNLIKMPAKTQKSGSSVPLNKSHAKQSPIPPHMQTDCPAYGAVSFLFVHKA